MAVKRPRAGVHYPRDFDEFLTLFTSEEDCIASLERVRWGQGFHCPYCFTLNSYWRMGDGRRRCNACRKETTVTAGTIFQGTRKELRWWFFAIWEVVNQKHGVSALGLQRTLGFKSQQTTWAWLHKIRRAMVVPDRAPLRGDVEVDETYFGGRKLGAGVGGRGAPGKTMVVVAVEDHGKGAGRCRMKRIKHADKPTLHTFIRENVEKGSTIITDGWMHYDGISKYGYTHDKRTISGSGKKAHELLPHVHQVIGLSKRWLAGTHQGSWKPKHLDFYLDEYCFRFNRRYSKNRGMLFYRLIEQAVVTPPHPYKDLVA
jgi:transposase-like protein